MLGIYSYDFQEAKLECQYVCCWGAYTTELMQQYSKKHRTKSPSIHSSMTKEVCIYISYLITNILLPTQPTLKNIFQKATSKTHIPNIFILPSWPAFHLLWVHSHLFHHSLITQHVLVATSTRLSWSYPSWKFQHKGANFYGILRVVS